MKKNLLTKGLTLLVFVLLLSAFLLYRAQVIDPFPTNVQPMADNNLPADTTRPPAMDSLKSPSPEVRRQMLMSSSKSIVVMKDDRKTDSAVASARATLMSSSKSSQVFSPAALQRLMDSMRIDSAVKMRPLRLRLDTSKTNRLKQ